MKDQRGSGFPRFSAPTPRYTGRGGGARPHGPRPAATGGGWLRGRRKEAAPAGSRPRETPAPARVRRRGGRGSRSAAAQALVAVLAAVALFMFLRSDYFSLRAVSVDGLQTLSADEVRRRAGLDRPVLIWEVWPRRVERLLLGHPRVAAARVDIRWPNRVVIAVEERQPAAYILEAGGKYVEVDGEGQVLALRDGLPGAGQPLVTGVTENNPQAGRRLANPLALRAVSMAADLGPVGRARASEINVNRDGEIVLYTMEGLPVFMGIDDRWEAKVRALLGILGSLRDTREVAYIDLRSSRRPVVKLKHAALAERAMGKEPGADIPPDTPLP